MRTAHKLCVCVFTLSPAIWNTAAFIFNTAPLFTLTTGYRGNGGWWAGVGCVHVLMPQAHLSKSENAVGHMTSSTPVFDHTHTCLLFLISVATPSIYAGKSLCCDITSCLLQLKPFFLSLSCFSQRTHELLWNVVIGWWRGVTSCGSFSSLLTSSFYMQSLQRSGKISLTFPCVMFDVTRGDCNKTSGSQRIHRLTNTANNTHTNNYTSRRATHQSNTQLTCGHSTASHSVCVRAFVWQGRC